MANQTSGAEVGLAVNGLTVRYGALTALDGVDLAFQAGVITGLIGPNGAGKTTLLNAVSGFTSIAGGTILFAGTDIAKLGIRKRVRLGIVRGFQTPRLLDREDVWTNVAVGCEPLGHPNLVVQLANLPAQRRAHERDRRMVGDVLELLDLRSVASRHVDELPFASRRLVEVARVLVAHPHVVLLDEPAAGLDADDRDALAAVIRRVHEDRAVTLVVVEHNVEFVRNLCAHVVALDYGRVISRGEPDAVLADAAVRTAYFGVSHDAAG